MIPRSVRLTTVGLIAALALTGCSGGDDSPSATPSTAPVTSSSPTPSSTPTPSPSSVPEKAAVEAVLAYIRVVDKLSIDPSSDIDELNTVATGDALAQMQYILLNYRKDGWYQVGAQVPAFESSKSGATASEWTITMCVDETAVDVFDADGNSVKSSDSQSHLRIDFEVVESLAAAQWYVARDKAIESC